MRRRTDPRPAEPDTYPTWELPAFRGGRILLAILASIAIPVGFALATPAAFATPLLWVVAAGTAVFWTVGILVAWRCDRRKQARNRVLVALILMAATGMAALFSCIPAFWLTDNPFENFGLVIGPLAGYTYIIAATTLVVILLLWRRVIPARTTEKYAYDSKDARRHALVGGGVLTVVLGWALFASLAFAPLSDEAMHADEPVVTGSAIHTLVHQNDGYYTMLKDTWFISEGRLLAQFIYLDGRGVARQYNAIEGEFGFDRTLDKDTVRIEQTLTARTIDVNGKTYVVRHDAREVVILPQGK